MRPTVPATTPEPAGSDAAARRRAGARKWMFGSMFAVVFEFSAVVAVVRSGRSGPLILLGLLGLIALTAGYVLAALFRDTNLPVRVAYLLAMVLVAVPEFLFIGASGVLGIWTYVGIAGAIMLPGAYALTGAAGLAGTGLLWASLAGEGTPWESALTMLALTAWMVSFVGNIATTEELRRTRLALAETAVAAERERIARDLHDILGHSLTAVAVKAGLSRRLLERLPDNGPRQAVAAEVTDIERMAREALADIRATTAGYRDISLAGELAAAAAVLRAAGVQVDISTAASEVNPSGRSVFGYVVREAVTNVVRHADAQRCGIDLTADSVTVTNDGTAKPELFGDTGHGLAGLTARLAEAGGTLVAGPLVGGGYRVHATVPHPAGPAGGTPEPAGAPAGSVDRAQVRG